MFFDAQIFGVSCVGSIMAVVKLTQDLGFPKKYSPILSVGMGLLAGVFLVDPGNWQQGLIDGLALGLSAIGVHSGVKNVREGVLNLLKKPDSISVQLAQPIESIEKELANTLESKIEIKPAEAATPEQPAQPQAQPQPEQPAQQPQPAQAQPQPVQQPQPAPVQSQQPAQQ